MPVTHGVTGSSPVRTAKVRGYISLVYNLFYFICLVLSGQSDRFYKNGGFILVNGVAVFITEAFGCIFYPWNILYVNLVTGD